MSVRHEDITVCSNGHVGRTVERVHGFVVAGHAFLPERHQLLSVSRVLVNHMGVSIREPEIPFTVQIDAVCIGKQPIAPGFLEFSITVKNKNRRIGGPEYEDRPLTIGGYRTW